MKSIITFTLAFILSLLCLAGLAATPSFYSFNTNSFYTNGNAIDVRWNTNSLVYWVSQNGFDTNVGTTYERPLKSPWVAAQRATNSGNVIHILPGTYDCGGHQIQLADNVSWFQDPGAQIIITNVTPGTTSYAMFRPGANSIIFNLNMYVPDTDTVDTPIGWGQSDGTTREITNVWFYNLRLLSHGTGLHLESSFYTNRFQWFFINPYVKANACCFVNKGITNSETTIINPIFIVTNFINVDVSNEKPFRVISMEDGAGGSGFTRVIGGLFSYSDQDLSPSNRPVLALRRTAGVKSTNNLVISGTSFLSMNVTNPMSFDVYGETNNQFTILDCYRADGRDLTVTNAFAGWCIVPGFRGPATNASAISGTSYRAYDGTNAHWTQFVEAKYFTGVTNLVPTITTNPATSLTAVVQDGGNSAGWTVILSYPGAAPISSALWTNTFNVAYSKIPTVVGPILVNHFGSIPASAAMPYVDAITTTGFTVWGRSTGITAAGATNSWSFIVVQ